MTEQDTAQEKTWYIRTDGKVLGHYTSARVRHLLLLGELDLLDAISRDKQGWKKLREVAEVIPVELRAQLGDKSAQLLHARRVGEAQTQAGRNQRFPLLPAVVVGVLLITVLGLSIWQGLPGPLQPPECQAQAAPGVNWRQCLLIGIDVGAASLVGANLNSSVLRQAKFTATNLSDADLRYADLREADISYALLKRAVLVGANLQGADLRSANLSEADLRFADLSGCRLQGVELHGAKLGDAIWYDGRICRAGSLGKCLR